MDTLKGLIAAVASIDLPWANGSWGAGDDPVVPYITIRATGGTSYGADNATWCAFMGYDVELYTQSRDYVLERSIEDALDANEIFWTKNNCALDDEGVSETVYSVTVRED